MSQKFRTLLFLCELSHQQLATKTSEKTRTNQQRNNIIDLAIKYNFFYVNALKEIITKYMMSQSVGTQLYY